MNWETILDKYGIPTLVMLVLGTVMFRVLMFLANRFVKYLDETTAQHKEGFEKIVGGMGEVSEALRGIAPKLENVSKDLQSVQQDVKTVVIRTENVRIESARKSHDPHSG